MKNTNLDTLLEKLFSQNWTDLMEAQSVLEKLIDIDEWKLLIFKMKDAPYTTVRVVVLHLVKYFSSTHFQNLDVLIKSSFFEENGDLSYLTKYEELCRLIIEAMLSTNRASYNAKVELLTELFELSHAKGFDANSHSFYRIIIRAMGKMRAKRAITNLEFIDVKSNPLLQLEAIKALRLIRDRKCMRHLEILMNANDQTVVNAAIVAYGELGFGLFSFFRLYKIYWKSSELIRQSVVTILQKSHPQVSFLILRKIYRRETNIQLKCLILRKMSQIYSKGVAEFVIHECVSSLDFKIRQVAKWSYEALPAEICEKNIKKNIFSDKPELQLIALKKAAQLNKSKIDKHLMSWFDHNHKSDPILVSALIYTRFQIHSYDRLGFEVMNDWLKSLISKETIIDEVIGACLLQLPKLNSNELFEFIKKQKEETKVTLLSFVAERWTDENYLIWFDSLKNLVDDRNSKIVSYLAKKIILKTYINEPNDVLFQFIWSAFDKSDQRQLDLLNVLFSTYFNHESKFISTPLNQLDRYFPLQEFDFDFISKLLFSSNASMWSLQKWKDLIVYSMKRPQNGKNTDSVEKIKKSCREFCFQSGQLFENIVNKIVLTERDPALLEACYLYFTMSQSLLSEETVRELFLKLTMGQKENFNIISRITFFSGKGLRLQNILDFITSIKNSKERHELIALLSNSKWLEGPSHV